MHIEINGGAPASGKHYCATSRAVVDVSSSKYKLTYHLTSAPRSGSQYLTANSISRFVFREELHHGLTVTAFRLASRNVTSLLSQRLELRGDGRMTVELKPFATADGVLGSSGGKRIPSRTLLDSVASFTQKDWTAPSESPCDLSGFTCEEYRCKS